MADEQADMVKEFQRRNNDFNVMQIRLDTTNFLQDIEKFLRGGDIVYINHADGSFESKVVGFGYPIANEKGIQFIMRTLRMHINTQLVQGTFQAKNNDSQDFRNFIADFQEQFGADLSINRDAFGISKKDYAFLCWSITNTIERYFSRSINNGERHSYNDTIKSIESNIIKNKGSILSNPFAKT